MNVIFLDIDGVLDTYYYRSYEDMENKIKILADICHTYDAKVVISSSHKDQIDEETMKIDSKAEWVLYLFYLFNKYKIDVIGRTPHYRIYKNESKTAYIDMWKEYEILTYLYENPEIEHYCIIDDDDLTKIFHRKSDLDLVRKHLVDTDYINTEHPESEGLQLFHKPLVGEILEKDNDVDEILENNPKVKELVINYRNNEP